MNKLSQFLGAAAVVIIALVFVLQFRPASDTALTSKGPTCAIEIQGDCIPVSHFYAEYRLLAPRGADADRLRAMNHRRRTSEGLVERWLLNEDTKRLGITVSDDDVTAELALGRAYVSLPVSEGPPNNLNNNYIHLRSTSGTAKREKFGKEALRTRGPRRASAAQPERVPRLRTPEDIAARMSRYVDPVARARGRERGARALRTAKSTVTLGYVKLDSRFYADVVADTSDKAIDAWADEQQRKTSIRSGRAVKRSTSRVPRGARDLRADPRDGHGQQKADSRKAIDGALERLNKGEDFADVAKSVSKTEETAQKGGAMGCVGRGHPHEAL